MCVSVKSHLTYGASVRPENAVTYSEGNEGKKICGVFSEDAPLPRSSGVAIVFHTFRWPFFFIAKAVRMPIGFHSYGCRTAREYPACPTIVNSFSLAQNYTASPRTDSTTRYSYKREAWPISAHAYLHSSQDSTRRGFAL